MGARPSRGLSSLSDSHLTALVLGLRGVGHTVYPMVFRLMCLGKATPSPQWRPKARASSRTGCHPVCDFHGVRPGSSMGSGKTPGPMLTTPWLEEPWD